MLTKTSETAITALLYLALQEGNPIITPKRIAQELGTSPTYTAKIMGTLVKMNILHAQRGVNGGVQLGRAPGEITLLEIVEACQGRLLGAYCSAKAKPSQVCNFHAAMLEWQQSSVAILNRWTLADLAEKPQPAPALRDQGACKMTAACCGMNNGG